MRLIFLGTPDFAVPTLDRLIAAGHTVLEVVTQPDRPKGRKQELIPSPVKAAAQRHAIPVWQPERIRRPESVEHLRALNPDAMVVVGYGQIIPQSIIAIAPLGIINVHASLLPELRGAAPIQWSIARGYPRTGVTTMRIDAGLDTGDMLLRAETAIGPDETALELSARLAEVGSRPSAKNINRPLQGRNSSRTARQLTRNLGAYTKKRRRAYRLEQSSPTNSQPHSRFSTLAGSLYLVPWPVASPLALASGCATMEPYARSAGTRAGRIRHSRRRRRARTTRSTT